MEKDLRVEPEKKEPPRWEAEGIRGGERAVTGDGLHACREAHMYCETHVDPKSNHQLLKYGGPCPHTTSLHQLDVQGGRCDGFYCFGGFFGGFFFFFVLERSSSLSCWVFLFFLLF
jgi:hypothetical protein